MKYYFLFGFFSVTKYVFLVTPETIQNTRRALTMTLDPQLDPNCWRKLGKFPRFSFCAPRNCPLFMSKSEAACLQMDLARSSRGVGRSNDYRYILTRTRTVHCARFQSRRKPPNTISRPSSVFCIFWDFLRLRGSTL